MSIKITGTGSSLPSHVMTNEDLSKLVDTSDEWIVSRTGIRSRHIALEGDKLSDFTMKAATDAMQMAGVQAADIELIVGASTTPDRLFPNCAGELQARIQAEHAVAFDVSAACTGFIYALTVATSMMKTMGYKHALVVGAELLSRRMDWTDRGTCVLFGDGAGAVVLSADDSIDDSEGIISTEIYSDGMRGECLTCNSVGEDHFIHMNGQDVFRFAVRTVPQCIEHILTTAGIQKSDVDKYILHQANERILESVSHKLGEDKSKFPMNLDTVGNTSGASIPVLLDELQRAGELVHGRYYVLCGFGAGLTWGSAIIRW